MKVVQQLINVNYTDFDVLLNFWKICCLLENLTLTGKLFWCVNDVLLKMNSQKFYLMITSLLSYSIKRIWR
jgi:hypothetical protein